MNKKTNKNKNNDCKGNLIEPLNFKEKQDREKNILLYLSTLLLE